MLPSGSHLLPGNSTRLARNRDRRSVRIRGRISLIVRSEVFCPVCLRYLRHERRLHVPTDNRLVARPLRKRRIRGPGSASPGYREPKVPTIMNDLLARQGLEHVDFVSMDIELAEPKALAGFDIDRFRPAFLSKGTDVRQAVLDYFMQHHYAVVASHPEGHTEPLLRTHRRSVTQSVDDPPMDSGCGHHGPTVLAATCLAVRSFLCPRTNADRTCGSPAIRSGHPPGPSPAR